MLVSNYRAFLPIGRNAHGQPVRLEGFSLAENDAAFWNLGHATSDFELLRQAYVNARYSPHYKISEKELTWLIERVSWLRELVEGVCRERLGTED